jgi:preprotein translocase subunit SecY
MRSLHVALGACYVMVVCVLPLLIYRWTVWPFVLSGFQIFLLGWVMTRILERVRASQQA